MDGELVKQEVLVMEYLPGIRLVDGVRAQFRKYAEQQGKTLEQLEVEQKEKVRLANHADACGQH
jgi:aarF domain-containing kinase